MDAVALRTGELWLLHAWSRAETNIGTSFMGRVVAWMQAQWQQVEQARDGSFYSYLRKGAHFVRERQDPNELFLSGIPPSANSLSIAYPEHWHKHDLHSHLLSLASSARPVHSRAFYKHCLIMLPFLPLAISPLPNAPLYYAWYRMYCSSCAFHGAAALQRLLSHPRDAATATSNCAREENAQSALPECTRLHLLAQDPTKHSFERVCCRAQTSSPDIANAELVPCKALEYVEGGSDLAAATQCPRGPKRVEHDAGLEQAQIEAIERICGARDVSGASMRIMHAARRRRGQADLLSRMLGR